MSEQGVCAFCGAIGPLHCGYGDGKHYCGQNCHCAAYAKDVVNMPPREALLEIANDLEGYSKHIREYVRGETTTLPMQWDLQDVYLKFKNILSA